MLVLLKSNYDEVSREAARVVASGVRQNPAIRLGLATGNTMTGVYAELARIHREDGLDFSRVVTFNLDEYLGISPHHPESFRHFMLEHFFFKGKCRRRQHSYSRRNHYWRLRKILRVV